MEDAELVFISVWGAGRSVDRPFCSVNDGGCRIKSKKINKKQNKKTIRLWAGSGSMSHDLQVREVAQTFIDPLTPAPFPSHVHTITWEQSASSGTHVPFTALLFLTNIYFFIFTSMWCLGSYCVHHILPASSRRPPSLTSQHEVWTEGKSDEEEEEVEEEKLRPLQPKCFWTSLNDSGWSVGSSVHQLPTHRPMVEGRWDRRWRRRETLANRKRERKRDEDQLEPRDESRSAEAAGVCGEKFRNKRFEICQKNTLLTFAQGCKNETCLTC